MVMIKAGNIQMKTYLIEAEAFGRVGVEVGEWVLKPVHE